MAELLFYYLLTKLQKGNVFTPVSHSVHRGGSLSRKVWSLSRGLPPMGLYAGGFCPEEGPQMESPLHWYWHLVVAARVYKLMECILVWQMANVFQKLGVHLKNYKSTPWPNWDSLTGRKHAHSSITDYCDAWARLPFCSAFNTPSVSNRFKITLPWQRHKRLFGRLHKVLMVFTLRLCMLVM